jgi:hypothetical protein
MMFGQLHPKPSEVDKLLSILHLRASKFIALPLLFSPDQSDAFDAVCDLAGVENCASHVLTSDDIRIVCSAFDSLENMLFEWADTYGILESNQLMDSLDWFLSIRDPFIGVPFIDFLIRYVTYYPRQNRQTSSHPTSSCHSCHCSMTFEWTTCFPSVS